MDELITVIIPVYNVEQYLKKCIESIIFQTYQNLEIILVNDGSTDASGKICDLYEKKDSRIQVIHKENGGLSDARNAGLQIMSGAYLLFVDSDDYLSNDYIQLLYLAAKNNNAEICVSDIVEFQGNVILKEKRQKPFLRTYTSEEALKVIFMQKEFDTSACGKLFLASLFKGIFFQKGILYEDFDLIYKIVDQAEKIVFLNEAKYYYLHRPNSIMSSSFQTQKLVLIKIAEEMLNFVEINYPNIRDAAIRRYVYSNFYLLGRAINNKDFRAETKKMRKNILRYRNVIFKNKEVILKEKIAVLCLFFGNSIYKIFWNIYVSVRNK